MAGNLVKTVVLKILGEDDGAEEKLDRISIKADELDEKHADLKVGVDTADADVKLAVLKGELKEAGKLEIKPKVSDKDLAESEGKLAALRATLFGTGAGENGGGILTTDLGEMLPGLFSPVGIAAIAAAIGPVLTELTGLASGFVAAGAGLGAFALLAIPTIDKIKNAYTNVTSAQQAYQAAVQLEAKDPTTTNKSAEVTALAKLRIAYDNISPATRKALTGIENFKSGYEKLATKLEPDVLKVFNGGLKIANDLLPDLGPLATAAAGPVDKLLGKLGNFFKTRTPIETGSYLQKGGKLIDQTQLTGFGQFLQDIKQLEGPAITAIGTGFGHIANNLGKLLTVMSSKDVVHAINIAFGILSGTIRGVTDVVKFSMTFWDDNVRVFKDVEHAAENVWKALKHAFDNVSHAAEDVWKAVKHAFDNVEHAGDVFSGDVASFMKRAGQDIENWYHDVVRWLGEAVTWFGELPGKIVHAIGNLGGMLFKAGANAISGLLNGMRSMVGGAIQDAENWGHDIISAIGSPFGIHFSEPSQASKMITAGRNIAMGLGIGIRSGTPSVSSAAANLARSAGLSGSTAGGAGGGTRVVLELSGSDQQILTAFAHALRVRGGSPSLIGLKTS